MLARVVVAAAAQLWTEYYGTVRESLIRLKTSLHMQVVAGKLVCPLLCRCEHADSPKMCQDWIGAVPPLLLKLHKEFIV